MGIKLPPLEHPVTVQGSRVAEEPWWLWFSDIYDQINGITIDDLTANRIVATNADKELVSVADLTSWIAGTGNRLTVSDDGDGTATLDISASYSGQNSITTLGTIDTGTWQGTVVDEVYGGTGQSSYTLGDLLYGSAANTLGKLAGNTTTTKQFLSQTGDGANSAAPAWAALTAGDIPTADLAGTSNQVSLSASGTGVLVGGTNITLSLPQDIHTGASPTFTGLTLSGLTEGQVVFPGAGGVLSGDADLFWDDSAKRLGIGTSSPGAKLHVVGPDGAGALPSLGETSYNAILQNNASVSDDVYLALVAGANGLNVINLGDTDDVSRGQILYNQTNDYLAVSTAGAAHTYWDSSGNFSLGAGSSPSAKLDVNGDAIISTTLTVGQDAVFNNDKGIHDFIVHGASVDEVFRVDTFSDVVRMAGDLRIANADPRVVLRDTDSGNNIAIRVLNGQLRFDDESAGQNWATFQTNGSFGIGTASPGAKLDVRGSAVFNEDGADVDFRIEGDTEQNLFFVDGSTDRIGIGTASPGAKLHVEDSGQIQVLFKSTGNASPLLNLDANPSGAGNNLATLSFKWNGNEVARLYATGGDDATNKDEANLVFRTANGGVLANRFVLHQEGHAEFTGDVGIGTSSPDAQLHVSGGTGSCEVVIEADTDNSGEADQPSLTFKQDGGVVQGKLGYFNSENELTLKNVYADSLHLGTNDTKRLTIESDGDVGIGTTSPNNLLHIKNGDLMIENDAATGGTGVARLHFAESSQSEGRMRLEYDGDNLGGDANRLSVISDKNDSEILSITYGEKVVFNGEDVTDSAFDVQMRGTGLFGLSTDTVTASSTDAQGEAPMTASINRITSVPDSSSSVTAPPAKFGAMFGVVNEGNFSVKMYPASSQEFREQDIGVPTSKTIQVGQYFFYVCMEDGLWHEITGP